MELESLRLGGRASGPHVLITGGVHGDEFAPMKAIRTLAQRLAGRELQGSVTLVPVVNEPAFRRGQRTADDGKDLARVCPGRADGSITERVADALAQLIRSSDVYIDLHTGGTRLQVYPLVGYMLHTDRAVLDRQRRLARAFGLPLIWGTDPSLEGRSLSVARDAGIPAIYAEYLGADDVRQGTSAYVQACLNALADLGVIDGPIVTPATPPLVVEDARPGSGHMQVQHPSPRAGFFEPAVRLGQRVAAGDLLGTVFDSLGREPAPVEAERDGPVIVLHTFPGVDRGVGLGVVIDTDGRLPTWGLSGSQQDPLAGPTPL